MIVQLSPGSIGPRIERIIPADVPARPRALAVIDGVLAGTAWADDPDEPTWTVVIEKADGTVYAAGAVSAPVLDQIMPGVETAAGDLIFGFTGPDDPLRTILPPDPYYRGEAIDFTGREAPPDEAAVLAAPSEVTVTRIGPACCPRPSGMPTPWSRTDRLSGSPRWRWASASWPTNSWWPSASPARGCAARWRWVLRRARPTAAAGTAPS